MNPRSFLQLMIVALLLLATATIAAESVPPNGLRIIVYGATGKVGTHVVDEALQRGHLVTAVSRDPSRIKQQHQNLSAVAGDLLDSNSIASLVVDQDVVVISVRGVVGKSKNPEDAIQRIAVEKVVNVLRDIGASAPRLIHV